MTPEQRFAQIVATDASQPFITYYDEASGERFELSAKSLANWVAKTHHLLSDELGLGLGDTALVSLPAHWLAVPILLGALSAGLSLVDDEDADVAFVSQDTVSDADGMLDVYAINTADAANGFPGEAPGGAQDYVAAVRPQADAWAGVHMPAGDADACFVDVSRSEVADEAAARAAALGLTDGGRLLSTREWTSPADWVDSVFAALAVSGSLVLVRNAPDEDVVEKRMTQERATARLH